MPVTFCALTVDRERGPLPCFIAYIELGLTYAVDDRVSLS